MTSEHICCRNTAINLVPVLLSLSPLSLETGTRPTKEENSNLRCKTVSVPQNTKAGNPFAYAPALLLQDIAYSYRVCITLIKLLYFPLQYLKIAPIFTRVRDYGLGCYLRPRRLPRRTLLGSSEVRLITPRCCSEPKRPWFMPSAPTYRSGSSIVRLTHRSVGRFQGDCPHCL